MSEEEKSLGGSVKLKLMVAGRLTIGWLSSVTARLVIILLVLVIVIALLYWQVWRSLRQSITLPSGVVANNLDINTDLLQQINAQRISRTSKQGEPFSVGQLFVPIINNAGR